MVSSQLNEVMIMNFDINNLPEEVTLSLVPIVSDYGTLTVFESVIDGYTQIGEPVDVTFKINQREEITGDMIEQLRQDQKKIKADAEVKCNHIADKINQLLALPQL